MWILSQYNAILMNGQIRRMCRNTGYMQRDRWKENQLAHVKVKS